MKMFYLLPSALEDYPRVPHLSDRYADPAPTFPPLHLAADVSLGWAAYYDPDERHVSEPCPVIGYTIVQRWNAGPGCSYHRVPLVLVNGLAWPVYEPAVNESRAMWALTRDELPDAFEAAAYIDGYERAKARLLAERKRNRRKA